jgi:hypothetical protein
VFAQKLADSTATYKIVVCPLAAYLEAGTEDVGRGCHDLRHIGAGSSLVISSKWYGSLSYYRETVNGINWIAIEEPYVLRITASQLGLHCVVTDTSSNQIVDVFDIVKPA